MKSRMGIPSSNPGKGRKGLTTLARKFDGKTLYFQHFTRKRSTAKKLAERLREESYTGIARVTPVVAHGRHGYIVWAPGKKNAYARFKWPLSLQQYRVPVRGTRQGFQ